MAFDDIETCCGYANVKQGAKVIGIFYSVIDLIGIIVMVVYLFIGEKMLTHLFTDSDMTEEQLAEFAAALQLMKIFAIATLVVQLITAVVLAVMIQGVRSDRRRLLLPWLIWFAGLFVMATLGSCYDIFEAFSMVSPVGIILSISSLLVDGLQWYWYLIVLKHYVDLQEPPRPTMMSDLDAEMMEM